MANLRPSPTRQQRYFVADAKTAGNQRSGYNRAKTLYAKDPVDRHARHGVDAFGGDTATEFRQGLFQLVNAGAGSRAHWDNRSML